MSSWPHYNLFFFSCSSIRKKKEKRVVGHYRRKVKPIQESSEITFRWPEEQVFGRISKCASSIFFFTSFMGIDSEKSSSFHTTSKLNMSNDVKYVEFDGNLRRPYSHIYINSYCVIMDTTVMCVCYEIYLVLTILLTMLDNTAIFSILSIFSAW